ncbi:MAG: hypothetical protein J6I85_09420 [Clostridia bacterium]|nr:hypothetical protein [Clostridia bacterium]
MLEHEERAGFVWLLISATVLLASLWGLLFFGISPNLCGVGFMLAAFIGFCGHFKILGLCEECKSLTVILVLVDVILIGAAIFGHLLLFNKI